METSRASIDECDARSNSAEVAGLQARGGFAHIERSTLNITGSQVDNNQVNVTGDVCVVKLLQLGQTNELGAFGGAISAQAASLKIQKCGFSGNRARNRGSTGNSFGAAVYIGPDSSNERLIGVSNFSDSNFTENIVRGPKAQGGGVWSGCRDLQLQGVLLRGNEAQAESDGDAAGGAMFISSSGSSSRTTARLWKVDITDNFARMITTVPKIRLALSANAGGLFVDAGVQAKLDDCTLRHNAAGGVGLYEERWSNAK